MKTSLMWKYLKKLVKLIFPNVVIVHFRSIRLKKLLRIGSASYIHPSVQVLGAENVLIGRNSYISQNSWINVNHRVGNEVSIDIGNNNWIGRDNFFSSGKSIKFSDYCLTAIGCKFISSSHVIDDPMQPYLTTGTTSDQSIRIGANCFFGAGVTVLGDIDIGHGSVIAANAFVLSNVPPFSVVVGNPARVIKRYSFSKHAWCKPETLLQDDFASQPDEATYLSMLKKSHGDIYMPRIAAGSDLGNL